MQFIRHAVYPDFRNMDFSSMVVIAGGIPLTDQFPQPTGI